MDARGKSEAREEHEWDKEVSRVRKCDNKSEMLEEKVS